MANIPARIKMLIKFFAVIFLLFAGYFYVSNFHEDDLKKFYLKFDTLGITTVGRSELNRIDAIKALSDRPSPVPVPQQDALINRTVFLGADNEMVTLALGPPIEDPTINDKGQQLWVYHFDDYNRPTYLYFEKRGIYWILVKAEKTIH